MGDSSSSCPTSVLALRALFLGSRRVSRRGITTDRKVLVPRGREPGETQPTLGAFCGLTLLDLRNRRSLRPAAGGPQGLAPPDRPSRSSGGAVVGGT